VKTIRFKDPKYVGDPINAIRIFNDKEVDELMMLDISATRRGRGPAFSTLEDVAGECFMPLAYGGGVTSNDDIRKVLRLGVEKVVLNTAAIEEPSIVSMAAREFGSQAIVVSIDVGRNLFGQERVISRGGRKVTRLDPVDFARRMEAEGAGELLLTSVERDGTQSGYDLDLLSRIASAVRIPVVISGGAGQLRDFQAAFDSGATAAAAGSMFVFTGKHRAVLITYPTRAELDTILGV